MNKQLPPFGSTRQLEARRAGYPMQTQRRAFLKGCGLVALSAYLPKLASATGADEYTSILHVDGADNALLGATASAGLLLHGSEMGSRSELWVVKGDGLMRVEPDKRRSQRIGDACRQIIRTVGGCRTGIIGMTVAGGSDEWMDRVDELARRSEALKRDHGCERIFCIVDVPTDARMDDAAIDKVIRACSGIDNWFVPVVRPSYKRNFVKCLRDVKGNQVFVSVNNRASIHSQQIAYGAGRITDVGSSRLA